MNRTRNDYWQVIRGICIIAVIWIHSRTGATYTNWNYGFWVVGRQVINFPVAGFLFLAGYFVNPDRLHPVKPWLSQRATKLLIPFYVWSLFYTLIALAGDAPDNPVALLTGFILGTSAGHLYFVLVLVQLTLLTPLLNRLLDSRWAWVWVAITPLYMAGIYAAAQSSGVLPDWYATLFPAWFAFYYAGIWSRRRGVSWAPSLGMSIAIAGIAMAASVGEAYLLLANGFPESLATSQLKATSILYAFALIYLAFAVKHRYQPAAPAMVRLGDDSYGIYYVHLFWIILVQVALSRVRVLTEFPILPAFQLAEVALALALSLAAIWVVRRFIGRPRAASIFGF